MNFRLATRADWQRIRDYVRTLPWRRPKLDADGKHYVDDANEPVYEGMEIRQRQEIVAKDRELARLFFAMLEDAKNRMLYAPVAVPTAYARLADPRGYPGNHWTEVIHRDPRMTLNGWSILYSDSPSPLGSVLGGEETLGEAPSCLLPAGGYNHITRHLPRSLPAPMFLSRKPPLSTSASFIL